MKALFKKTFTNRQRAIIKSTLYSFPERFRSLDFGNLIISTNAKYLYELRRAIHRLEKSLTFNIRKPGGGMNITNEIYELMKLNREKGFADPYTLDWALQVLCQQQKRLKQDLIEFSNINPTIIKKNIDKIDYFLKNNHITLGEEKSNIEPSKPFTANDLLCFFKSRHSVRSFESIIIDQDKINIALEIAKFTPTPCNKQSTKVSIVQNKDIIIRILKLQGGIVGYEEQIYNLAVISSTREAYPGFQEKHSIFTEGALFGMNFIWGLHIQNISTVILNWIGNSKKTKELNKILNLSFYYKHVFIIAFGYSKKNIPIPNSPRQDTQSFLNIIDKV